MRNTIIVSAAIAILGLLGVAAKTSGAHQLVAPTSTSAATGAGGSNMPMMSKSTYKDGTFTGDAEFNPYGTVQIAVVISGGKITDVNYLQMPEGAGHTNEVTAAVKPLLKQSTLQVQGPNIDFVSGATTTSESYQMSLQSALDRAATSSSSTSSHSTPMQSQPNSQPSNIPTNYDE